MDLYLTNIKIMVSRHNFDKSYGSIVILLNRCQSIYSRNKN